MDDHPGVLSSSPKDHLHPELLHEFLGNASNLKMLLGMETQQEEKAMAMARAEMAECSGVAELEQQLQAEAQKKHTVSVETEMTAAKRDNKKVKMLEVRLANLEKQLEDQNHSRTEIDKQVNCVF